MIYPANQCRGCGSLPDDPETDRVLCDFCRFGVEDAAQSAVGEWALAVFLTLVLFYFIAHIYFWLLRAGPGAP